MEEYTNKYMQVFDTYDDFAQHSADYVKGEDHIAYLIQENEVIYWLYLEQVWRPLNVRTTTTGQLEDGRTKVAVRLEYVEGGQKYTSVPNIPDPERITSMSHFLEDYPDIEEVNVTGTINLTDLSYAFAGSKIKDFSMLDTDNVNHMECLLKDVNAEGYNFTITSNVEELYIDAFAWELVADTITINILNAKKIAGNIANNITTRIKKLIVNYDVNKYTYINTGSRDFYLRCLPKCEYIKYPNLTLSLENEIENKEITIESNKVYIGSGHYTTIPSIINIISDEIDYEHHNYPHTINSKWILKNNNVNMLYHTPYPKVKVDFGFGYGIQGDYNIIFEREDVLIGDFWFTTPIVDDAFYAKYNHPISIFQYKTTFTEVADVNITEATDSSLIYVDWGSINFDTSEMSVEIYNIVDITNICLQKQYKNLIIDNTNLTTNFEIVDLPILATDNKFNNNTNGLISGKYKTFGNAIYYNKLLKNIDIYEFYYGTNFPVDAFDSTKNYNIIPHIDSSYISSDYYGFISMNYNKASISPKITYINIDNLIINNELVYNLMSQDIYNYIFNYVENAKINITTNVNMYLYPYYYYLSNTSSDNMFRINFNGRNIISKTYMCYTKKGTVQEFTEIPNDIDTIYIDMQTDEHILFYLLDYHFNNNAYKSVYPLFKINNIKGNINLGIPDYISTYTPIEHNYNNDCHIDITISVCQNVNGDIRVYYDVVDNETTINIITKLIDNTSESTKTIYMYRSQANIIGDDNIAAAVAKNYEFAIIEN